MKLDVPIIYQEKGSVHCGLAGLAMLFKYYDVPISFDKLKKEISVDKVGTYAPQLGSYLIGKGFDVEITTMHPKLFTLADMDCSNEDVVKKLDLALSNEKISDQDKKVIIYFKEFIQAGGSLHVHVPSLEEIKSEIDALRPFGALMTTNFLNREKPAFNFHFNIITGYDDTYIYANDPLVPEEGGGIKKYEHQSFFYGLYASTFGDLDNACFIKLKKRS